MKGLRLLLVTDAVGGVWVYTLELARALRSFDIEAIIAVVGPPVSRAQLDEAREFRLVHTGLPLEWLDTSPSQLVRASESLADLANDEQVDIVQTSSAALLASGDFRRACVAVQHSCIASWWAAVKGTALGADFDWRRDFVQRGLNRADAIVAPSIAFAEETSRIYGLAVTAVHNGRTPMAFREMPQGEFVFTAGRLWDEGKNVATLDEAARNLSVPFQAAGPVVGPNGSRAHLSALQALGTLSEARLRGAYAARPIYASAALYEPFGLSVLEAAQAGCALVLSDIPTHREIWGGAAVFVEARSGAGFASAIRDLIEDGHEREQLGRLAARRAAHYSPARMARRMAEVYARLSPRFSEPIALAGVA